MYDGRYLLHWTGYWSYADDACNSTGRVDNKGVYIVFDEGGDGPKGPDFTGAADVDILQATACPRFDRVAQFTYDAAAAAATTTATATTTCPLSLQTDTGAQGTPCAVKIDSPVASSLSSGLASLASKQFASTSTTATTKFRTSTSSG